MVEILNGYILSAPEKILPLGKVKQKGCLSQPGIVNNKDSFLKMCNHGPVFSGASITFIFLFIPDSGYCKTHQGTYPHFSSLSKKQ